MMLQHVVDWTLPDALSLLPERMDSPEARVMLIAIGLQESRFTHRRQVRGPAHGFWQFEQGNSKSRAGVWGVLAHHATAGHVLDVCAALCYPTDADTIYQALPDNDTLAACFARLLLWTHPRALPALGDAEGAWGYYLDTWRPGKPHRGTWNAFHREAVGP